MPTPPPPPGYSEMSASPPPPPGFSEIVPDQRPEANGPPPPPGFTEMPKESGTDESMGNVLSSAIADPVKEMGQTVSALRGQPSEKQGPQPEFKGAWNERDIPQDWPSLVRAVKKGGYQIGSGWTEMVGAGLGGRFGPVGVFSGAAVMSAARSLGPYFYAEIEKGKSPEDAWAKAIEKTSVGAVATGASFTAFGIAPFQGAVKNMLFQAFGLQPAIAVAGEAGQQAVEGKFDAAKLGGAAVSGSASTVLAAGAHVIGKGTRATVGAAMAPEVREHIRTMGSNGLGEVIAREWNQVFALQDVSPESRKAGELWRSRSGWKAQVEEESERIAHHREPGSLVELAKGERPTLDQLGQRMTPEEALNFTDALEIEGVHAPPALQPMADKLRTVMDKMAAQAEAEGVLEPMKEGYFPHIFKQGEQAVAAIRAHGAKLGMPSGWMRERKYEMPLSQIVAEVGLEPVSYNPVRTALARVGHMAEFLTTHRFLKDMESNGLRKLIKPGEDAPTDWRTDAHRADTKTRTNERGERVIDGKYYYPPEVAALVKRIQEKSFFDTHTPKAYATARALENALNLTQLGLSPFHLWFVTSDAMSTLLGLGIREFSQGPKMWKSAARHIVEGASPLAGPLLFKRGEAMKKARQSAWEGSPIDPHYADLIDPALDATMKARIPDAYKFWENGDTWRSLQPPEPRGALGKVTHAAAAPFDLMANVARFVSKPLMEYYVPTVKMGAWSEMMRSSMEADPAMTSENRARLAQYHWDTVEDRMGELNTDLTFMPKTFVNAMWLTLRSFSWKFGDVRVIGGGIKDSWQQIAGGQHRYAQAGQSGMSDRAAYLMGMVMVNALGASVMQMAFTGKGPSDLKDLMFPRDGTVDRYGNPNRRVWWGYVKDEVQFLHAPMKEVQGSLSPMIQMVKEYVDGTDGAGRALVNPYDTKGQQALEWLSWAFGQFVPIGLGQKSREAGREEEHDPLAMAGIASAPAWISQDPDEAEAIEEHKQRRPVQRALQAGKF